MTDMEMLKYVAQNLKIPHLPYIVITNDAGQIRIELVQEKEFIRRVRAGDYIGWVLLDHVPKQDKHGAWIGVPKNSILAIKGALGTLRGPAFGMN